ncbi:MAG: DUF1186 domain-containing protein, partial [Desulfobacterales bacterium]
MGGDFGGKDPRLIELIDELQTIDCRIESQKLKELASFGSQLVPHLEEFIHKALQKSATQNHQKLPQTLESYRVVHALYLLAHLKSEKSLALILEFLAQKQEIVDFWLSDFVSDEIWEVLFLLGKNQLQRLEGFILDQHKNVFSRLAVCTAIVQIALHYPAKKQKAIHIFRQLLNLKCEEPDFMGLVVSELLDLKEASLRDDILQALQRNEVWSGIISAEEVDWCYANKRPRKLTPLNIFKRYALLRQ